MVSRSKVWILSLAMLLLLAARPSLAADGVQGHLATVGWLQTNLSRADLVLNIFGDEFQQLETSAFAARDLLVGIAPGSDIEFDAMGRQPMIEVVPRRDAMGKYGIPDIRMLYENDLRFLEQL